MPTLTYAKGDATAPIATGPRIIAHICNDVGGWGKGFVLAVTRRWPEPERAYRRWFKERDGNDFRLGSVQLVQVEDDLWVANMVAQHGLRRVAGKPPIRYEAVECCLATLADHAAKLGASVHMPRIGAGLAGGDWAQIEPIILRTLGARDIPTTVYDLD
jgi:O-acetyl-ADP-ribose deacetylase (regulator of RNase III)